MESASSPKEHHGIKRGGAEQTYGCVYACVGVFVRKIVLGFFTSFFSSLCCLLILLHTFTKHCTTNSAGYSYPLECEKNGSTLGWFWGGFFPSAGKTRITPLFYTSPTCIDHRDLAAKFCTHNVCYFIINIVMMIIIGTGSSRYTRTT